MASAVHQAPDLVAIERRRKSIGAVSRMPTPPSMVGWRNRELANGAVELLNDVAALITELERTEGDLGVAVREACSARGQVDTLTEALGAVHQLHQPDEEGFCRSCRTFEWPCPTYKALAGES